jgi:hypothetical protein
MVEWVKGKGKCDWIQYLSKVAGKKFIGHRREPQICPGHRLGGAPGEQVWQIAMNSEFPANSLEVPYQGVSQPHSKRLRSTQLLEYSSRTILTADSRPL